MSISELFPNRCSNWWLELEVTPVTIDGPTVGNIEFSHKSYRSVLATALGAIVLASFRISLCLLLCIACLVLLAELSLAGFSSVACYLI